MGVASINLSLRAYASLLRPRQGINANAARLLKHCRMVQQSLYCGLDRPSRPSPYRHLYLRRVPSDLSLDWLNM